MNAKGIAVLEGKELEQIADWLAQAVQDERKVRLTVEGGLKIAVGGESWTLPYGRVGDECGQ